MNNLPSVATLNNRYYLMRHGKSLANENKIIISLYSNGLSDYGLSETGREQLRRSIRGQEVLGSDTVIVASDFLRTRESAALAAELLNCPPLRTSELLRERGFGDYEKTSDANYKNVWVCDEGNDDNKEMGVESPREVRDRFAALIMQLEKEYSNCRILLVSHGDVLQIAQTWAEGCAPCEHRSLKHLETAEIRAFNAPSA